MTAAASPTRGSTPKVAKLGLSTQEKADLLAFLRSLEGDWKPLAPPALPK